MARASTAHELTNMQTFSLETWSSYDAALAAARNALLADELIIYPTDTLYGIGANALHEKAVAKVVAAKGRDNKPISIIVSGLPMMQEYAEVSDGLAMLLQQLLPGPFTVILKSRKNFPASVSATKTIGVRVPHHIFITTLTKELGFPITSTSANISGEASPTSFSQIHKKISSACPVGIDGGKTRWQEGSTIIDFTKEKAEIIRKGAQYGLAEESIGHYNSRR